MGSRSLIISAAERKRWKWLLAWMRQHGQADTLNRDLVDAYCEETDAKAKLSMIGADRCRRLAQDLGRMAYFGYAERTTTGIGDGLCHQGFPKWVWSYKPGKHAHMLEKMP